MDPLTGAVIITGLTTVGKPTAEALANIVGRILGPSLDAVGEGVSAPLQEWAKRRSELASKTVLEAAAMLHNAKVEPQVVPGRILWPVLERSSIEEDSGLRRRWSALLANASIDANAIPPAFTHILAALGPTDARLLDWIFEQSPYRSSPPSGSYNTVSGDRLLNEFTLAPETLIIILTNLGRNDLIYMPPEYRDPRGLAEHRFQHTAITTYGVAFVRACRPPQKLA